MLAVAHCHGSYGGPMVCSEGASPAGLAPTLPCAQPPPLAYSYGISIWFGPGPLIAQEVQQPVLSSPRAPIGQ